MYQHSLNIFPCLFFHNVVSIFLSMHPLYKGEIFKDKWKVDRNLDALEGIWMSIVAKCFKCI